jgi:hypothetical protein
LVTIFMGCHFWGDEGVAILEGGTWSIGPLALSSIYISVG